MKTSVWNVQAGAVAVMFAASALIAGCGLSGPGVDPLTGPSAPSEFGLSVTLSASPDQLPRDGTSRSTITVTVRDAQSRPVSNQRLSVSTSAGAVSESTITTNSEGQAAFSFIAPDAASGNNEAVVRVLPIGVDSQSAVARTVTILLGGTSRTAPTASFTVSPEAPELGQSVVFDASQSVDEGTTCLDACTYSWDFGGEATRSGRIATYQFRAVKTYPVRLTVTDRAGSSGTVTQSVAVAQGALPTAAFGFSPTSPGQYQTVNFTAAASLAASGKSIAAYEWRFGDGSSATGMTTSHAYDLVGTFSATLTVTDSAGLISAVTQPITVVNGVTASFTISPSPTSTTIDTIFDTEGSQGSGSGFGSRNTIVQYIWNFGDSTDLETTTNRTIAHRFTRTGSHTVNLTVVDSAGRRGTTTRTISVS